MKTVIKRAEKCEHVVGSAMLRLHTVKHEVMCHCKFILLALIIKPVMGCVLVLFPVLFWFWQHWLHCLYFPSCCLLYLSAILHLRLFLGWVSAR